MGFVKVGLFAAFLAALFLVGSMVLSLRFGLGATPYGPALATVIREIVLAEGPAAAAVAPAQAPQDSAPGLASGDITPTSAVVWVRWAAPGEVFVRLWKEDEGEGLARLIGPYQAVADQDFAVTVALDGLEPDTVYRFDTTLRMSTQDTETMVA